MKMQKLILQAKEGRTGFVQMYFKHYGCTLSHIMELVNELKKDFPFVADEDVTIQKYGGDRLKGVTFIEFSFSCPVHIPEGYTEIGQLKYTLS